MPSTLKNAFQGANKEIAILDGIFQISDRPITLIRQGFDQGDFAALFRYLAWLNQLFNY